MLGVKINLEDAQKLKEYLLENNLLGKNFKIIKENCFLVFPITKKSNIAKKFPNVEISDFSFSETIKKDNKKELLSKLTESEIEKLKTAFDIIGDIAVIEVDEELEKKEKLIAEFVMLQNKNIKTAKLDISYTNEQELKALYNALKSLIRRRKILIKATMHKDRTTNKHEIYLIRENP